jgi:hypothetical protein
MWFDTARDDALAAITREQVKQLRSRCCRRDAGGAGVSVSAVTWEGDIASTGAVGVAGSGIRPAATVGVEVGAEVSGGAGFCWTSGCFESSETQMTDAARTTRKAASRPPPTIT